MSDRNLAHFLINHPVSFANTVLFTAAMLNFSRAALGYDVTIASPVEIIAGFATGVIFGMALTFYAHRGGRQEPSRLPLNISDYAAPYPQ